MSFVSSPLRFCTSKWREQLLREKKVSNQEIVDLAALMVRFECIKDFERFADANAIEVGKRRLEAVGLLGTLFPIKNLLKGKPAYVLTENPATVARLRSLGRKLGALVDHFAANDGRTMVALLPPSWGPKKGELIDQFEDCPTGQTSSTEATSNKSRRRNVG